MGSFRDDTANDLGWTRLELPIGRTATSRSTLGWSRTHARFGFGLAINSGNLRSNSPSNDDPRCSTAGSTTGFASTTGRSPGGRLGRGRPRHRCRHQRSRADHAAALRVHGRPQSDRGQRVERPGRIGSARSPAVDTRLLTRWRVAPEYVACTPGPHRPGGGSARPIVDHAPDDALASGDRIVGRQARHDGHGGGRAVAQAPATRSCRTVTTCWT